MPVVPGLSETVVTATVMGLFSGNSLWRLPGDLESSNVAAGRNGGGWEPHTLTVCSWEQTAVIQLLLDQSCANH